MGGLDDAAERAGLQHPFEIRLARREFSKNGPTLFAINTESQLELELPLVISGSDNIQGN